MVPYWTQERLNALPPLGLVSAHRVGETALGWATRVNVEWRNLAGLVVGRGHFYRKASQ